jgi:hypothetical protein
MNEYYILDGHKPVPADLITWGKWMMTADRHVAKTMIGDVWVSTVFLGLNHAWDPSAQPLLFETMIFGGEHNQYQDRCCTWKRAEEMHEAACALVKSTPAPKAE